MNRNEVMEILKLYRPGSADAQDPEFAEALRFCDQDSELRTWLDQHCAVYAAMRKKFREVTPPEGLKEQIVAERRVRTTPSWRRPAILLASVAAVAVLTGIVFLLLPSREDTSYPVYRSWMTQIARTGYGMALATNDLNQIRTFLAKNGAPADYDIPAALHGATPTGCAIETWLGAKVSMICFRSDRPLPPNQSSDLWLFVARRGSIDRSPADTKPAFVQVNGAISANWASDNSVYTLVTDGDADFLRKYL
jgi:hypothetical protein